MIASEQVTPSFHPVYCIGYTAQNKGKLQTSPLSPGVTVAHDGVNNLLHIYNDLLNNLPK